MRRSVALLRMEEENSRCLLQLFIIFRVMAIPIEFGFSSPFFGQKD